VVFLLTDKLPKRTVLPGFTVNWFATEASSVTIRSVVVVVPPTRALPVPGRVRTTPPVDREIVTAPFATVKSLLSFT